MVASRVPPTGNLAHNPGTCPGNRTGDPLVCRPALNPRSYTSQGYILLIILLHLSQFFPLCPPLPFPQAIPALLFMSTGREHINSLASSFPILYFTSPQLFCNYLFVLLNPLTSSPIPPHLPSGRHQNTFYIHDSVSVLVCLVCFLDSIVDRYVFYCS